MKASLLLAALVLAAGGDLESLLERLRRESPGEYEKVLLLPRAEAERFLRERYGAGERTPPKAAPKEAPPGTLAPRTVPFEVVDTVRAGGFSVDLVRAADGSFGVGAVRRGDLDLRRTDFPVAWTLGGRRPFLAGRDGATVRLRDPGATIRFVPEEIPCGGLRIEGLRIELRSAAWPVVETASWEPGCSTRGLSYFDGYRGWHAPPRWLPADAVPPTNPKLRPSLLAGAGFQFLHGPSGALALFHATPGDSLENASRGEALEFVTTFAGEGPVAVDRRLLLLAGGSRADLWSRAFEASHGAMRESLGLPAPPREAFCVFPPHSRKGFRETAAECAAAAAADGFTGALLDVVWDNADFHGGAKNMNVWDLSICGGYGGAAGLEELLGACRRHGLRTVAWAPAGHLASGSPVWKEHPDWVLRRDDGAVLANPSGPWQGRLDAGFGGWWRGRIAAALRAFPLDGLWLDSHLAYAQPKPDPLHGVRLASAYREFAAAGARILLAEGDASVFAGYAVGIGDEWRDERGELPDPELFLGATPVAWFQDPDLVLRHFRRWTAAGAPWAISWDFLHSGKLTGPAVEAARAEVRRVLRDYGRVRDRMVHRSVHPDGSGTSWTNDRDGARVVWLLRDAPLPDGRPGMAGEVHILGE